MKLKAGGQVGQRRKVWRWGQVTCLSAALVLGTLGEVRAADRPIRIVAVGDSYASGEGAIGAGWSNEICHRSVLAAPEQASTQLNGFKPTRFTSAACSGATTAGLIGQLGTVGATAERIDALTMSIGGNDLGFASIVTSCLAPGPAGYSCHLDPNVLAPLATALAALDGSLDAVVAAVQGPGKVVPDVRNVFVTEYPDPTSSPIGFRCGHLLAPGFQGFEFLSEAESEWASRSVIAPLNGALFRMVERANAQPGPRPRWHFVRDTRARFAGHGFCAGVGSFNPQVAFVPRFFSTVVDSLTSQGDQNGAMHPNDLGQQQLASMLVESLTFLTRGLSVAVEGGPAVVGVPASIRVRVTTSHGLPVPGASVRIGTSQLDTDQFGTAHLNGLTFGQAGVQPITVDLDPYPMQGAELLVLANDYQATSAPGPIPVESHLPSLLLEARDLATRTLIGGLFEVDTLAGVHWVASGSSVALFLRKIEVWREAIIEGPRGKPKKVRWKEVTCPRITFRPSHPAYQTKNVSHLVDCQPESGGPYE